MAQAGGPASPEAPLRPPAPPLGAARADVTGARRRPPPATYRRHRRHGDVRRTIRCACPDPLALCQGLGPKRKLHGTFVPGSQLAVVAGPAAGLTCSSAFKDCHLRRYVRDGGPLPALFAHRRGLGSTSCAGSNRDSEPPSAELSGLLLDQNPDRDPKAVSSIADDADRALPDREDDAARLAGNGMEAAGRADQKVAFPIGASPVRPRPGGTRTCSHPVSSWNGAVAAA